MPEYKQYHLSSREAISQLMQLKRLPSFPKLLLTFDRLAAKPGGAHIDEVAMLIMTDPRLTAGILSVANSAKYSAGSTPVVDVKKAVSLLGVNDIRVMIVALQFTSMINQVDYVDRDALMRYSVVSAFIAKGLSSILKVDSYNAFLIGLFHELGLYVLATYHSEAFLHMTNLCMGKLTRLLAAERRVFNVTHPVLGARLLKTWQFPDEVVSGIMGHHCVPAMERDFQKYAYLSALAESGAGYLGLYNGVAKCTNIGILSDATQFILKRFDITEEQYIHILEEAQKSANSIMPAA